ncbi:hypothetical protein AAE478_008877 [Parahypoxylon ruwenzoriense]
MRFSTVALLPFAGAATAIVIPDDTTAEQLVVEAELSAWWDKVPASALHDFFSSAEDTLDTAVDAFKGQASKLNSLLPKLDSKIGSEITNFLFPSDYTTKPGESGHHGGKTNLTVYQSIHASNYTKKFAALVDEFPDLVEKLNSTSANVTIFVPTDKAFEKIPHHKDRKPSKELLEKIIQYHIVPGFYPAGRVLAHHTLPTALEEEALGGRPQRLRVSVGLFGVRLNFYSRVIVANLLTKNGVIHGVESILVPPPPVGKLISLFPSKFSTLELAAEKTGFAHHHDHHDDDGDHDAPKLTGLTFFAPTNTAFRKLGPAANAFLFNTEKGLSYLKALLKYHAVVNETLYSDEYYGKQKGDDNDNGEGDGGDGGDGDDVEGTRVKHYHVDLPTLLGDRHIAVDITRWYGFIKVRVNGRVDVAIQDGLGKNGVVQVVDSVLIPPHRHRGSRDDGVDGAIPVDELIERLQPFVVDEDVEAEAGEL